MEPANFPEIYTGNGDESDRMQDIAGCFDPIIPRNDGFQYDIEAAASDVCHGKDKWKLPILPVAPGKIIPGRSARPPSPAPGRKNHPRRGCGIFPPLHLRLGLMDLPEATDPFGIKKPHNILFIACAINDK